MTDLLYKHHHYKEFLQEYIKKNKRTGLVSELALAAGCDRTYFSQMLSSKVQLTPDHTEGLTRYFQFDEEAENYFLLLVLKDRASSPQFAAKLEKKIQQAQKKALNLTQQLKSKTDHVQTENMLKYYSEWTYAAIHILTSSSDFQSLELICEKLNMKPIRVRNILNDLLAMQLVKKEGSKYIHSGKNIHVPDNSPFNKQNHFNWRIKAVEDIGKADSVHYSATFTLAKKDFPALRQKLIRFIEDQRHDISSSGSDDLYSFCADLFEVE